MMTAAFGCGGWGGFDGVVTKTGLMMAEVKTGDGLLLVVVVLVINHEVWCELHAFGVMLWSGPVCPLSPCL